MQKTVKLALNAFPTIPTSLIDDTNNVPLPQIPVDLADLYHHYYQDTYGHGPPVPDPAHFEHAHHLLACPEFRFKWNGLGINKTGKGNKSNELGQAFCRWFLCKHLGIDYVAHLDDVCEHGALQEFGGISVRFNPKVEGDAPDYFCATATNQVSLAEAKGTIQAVGFGTKTFQTWRKQFGRIQILNRSRDPICVKGVIVAMRWAFESDSAKIRTTLSAEDPETEGTRPLGPDTPGLAYAIKALNYVASLNRLRQPLLAAALERGARLQPELLFNATVWQSFWPELKGLRFVGGYFPKGEGTTLPYKRFEGKLIHNPPDPLRLDIDSGTFIGIEEGVFRTLAETARFGPARIGDLRPIPRRPVGYSGLSLLPDGQVLGPIEFFAPVEEITL